MLIQEEFDVRTLDRSRVQEAWPAVKRRVDQCQSARQYIRKYRLDIYHFTQFIKIQRFFIRRQEADIDSVSLKDVDLAVIYETRIVHQIVRVYECRTFTIAKSLFVLQR